MTPEELRALRKRHNLTQKAMAAKLGLSVGYYKRMETGKDGPVSRAHITARTLLMIQALFPEKKEASPP